MNPSHESAVASALESINAAWLGGRAAEMSPFIDPGAVMVAPGFAGEVRGRDAFVRTFEGFGASATVHDYAERDLRVDVVGDTAVASYAFAMVYERDGGRWRATGRDLWVFGRDGGRWLARWRTMLDLGEEPADSGGET